MECGVKFPSIPLLWRGEREADGVVKGVLRNAAGWFVGANCVRPTALAAGCRPYGCLKI